MAVKVYLGGAPAARREMTYEEADAFSLTAGGFLLIQRQHSGEQKDVAVFAPPRGSMRKSCGSASAAVAARLLEVYYDTDIRALLPLIRARTAVLHRAADKETRFELGREVAALIPGATIMPLPGSSAPDAHTGTSGAGRGEQRNCR